VRAFLQHLLGLDEHHQYDKSRKNRPSNRLVWLETLKHIKPSHFFKGIRITDNFAFFLLCCGFTAWLYVVYAVRQTDQFTAQVHKFDQQVTSFGMSVDRQLMTKMQSALPVKIAPNSNGTSTTALGLQPPASVQAQHSAIISSSTSPGAAVASSTVSNNIDPRFGLPERHIYTDSPDSQLGASITQPSLMPAPYVAPLTSALPLNVSPIPSTWTAASRTAISAPSDDGRLRTIVSR
jgi:hypothetical protein